MKFKGKNISIIGLVRSGVAVAKLLDDMDANVLVTDLKSADELRENTRELEGRDIQYVLGTHDERCIEKADLVVISPGVPIDIPLLNMARAKDIPILGELEVAYQVCKAPIIAVTGTKGKSTTTSLIGDILKKGKENLWVGKSPQADRRRVSSGLPKERATGVRVAGNIGIAPSQEVRHLADNDIAVWEVSSFQLESTHRFHPIVSVILNITPDHLDRHKTIDKYIEAKKKIFANQTYSDYIVLNADSPIVSKFAEETKAQPVFFSRKKVLDIGAFIEDNHIVTNFNGEKVLICPLSEIKLLGAHNLENILAAVAVGSIFKISAIEIQDATSNFRGLKDTLEFVKELNGVKFINDTKATNVDAVRAALQTVSGPVLLIMGGYDKGNDYAPLVELLQTKVKGLILLGRNTGGIRDALANHTVTYNADTMQEAVEIAYSHASNGDYVLLSPANASFDLFVDYKARGEAFRKAVEYLEQKR